MKRFSLRLLAVTLAVAMLAANCATSVIALDALGVSEQTSASERETVTVTNATIVADYYGFISAGEQSILNCSAITADTHKIPVPSDNDDLISINVENKTVSVKKYSQGDYTWEPTRAYLVYQDAIGSEIKLPVDLDKNGNGTFDASVESYSIEVEYQVKVAIDVDTQRDLANAPARLVNGIVNLDNAVACEDNLSTIASEVVFSALLKMTEPIKISDTSSMDGFFTPTSEGGAYNAIKAMELERKSNGGTFAICNDISDYKQSANKVEHLLTNGPSVKSDAERMLGYIAALTDKDYGLSSRLWFVSYAVQLGHLSQAEVESIYMLNDILESLKADLEKITEENWAVLDSNPVKQDATENELKALNLAVLAAKGSTTLHDGETFVEAPVAATTTVKAGVAQSYVNVTVKAQVVDVTNTLSSIEGKSARFLMADGASDEDIKTKVEAMGVRQDSLAYWTNNATIYNIDSEYYTYKTTITHNNGESFVEIVYTPKTYEVTFDYAESVTVYYGHKLALENHSNPAKSYDYKVNGEAKYQGDVIVVDRNLKVTRVEGVALKGTTINAVVAESLISKLSPEALNILKVNSFKTTKYEPLFGAIRYRVPSVASLEATEVPGGYKVTAPSVSSGMLSGSVWTATSVDVIDENGSVILAGINLIDGVAEFTCEETFASVRVNFELVVEGVSVEHAGTLANLPYILTNEAAGQLEILNRMADGSLYSALGSLSAETINLIVTVVGGSKMSDAAKESVARLKTDCVDAAGNILLYSYLDAYKKAKDVSAAEGLKYYYTANNAANIQHQLKVLSEVFNALCPDDANNPDRKIFTDLLASYGEATASYVEKLDSIRAAIDDCKDIASVNEYVDSNSASLGALASAICNAIGKTQEYTDNKAIVLTSNVTCAAPDRSSVKVVINVVKGDGTIDSYEEIITLPKGTVIGNLIKDKFNALDETISIDKNYYSVEGVDTIPAGDVVVDDVNNVIVTYTPYTYTVSVPGTTDQTFSYDADWTVTLPASPNNSTKLVYTVAGAKVEVVGEAVRYTFADLSAFGTERRLDVTVESVDLENEKFITFINILNEAVGEVGGRFIPVKDEAGNIIVVFRVSSDISTAIEAGVLTNLPMALAMYESVSLGGSVLWDGSQVHLQAMTDMVANSGFSFDRFCDVITADGKVINDKDLAALEAMISAKGNIGGTLMASSINLDGRDIGFYVTLSDTTSSSMLSKMRSAVATVKNYANIVCEDGQFKFVITAPDSVYPYYLAQMLVSGNVDITDISSLNLRDSIRYEWGLIKNVLTDDRFSAETFENTLGVLGKEVNLSGFDGIFNNFKKANYYLENNIDVVVNECASDEYSATFMIDLSGVFGRVADKFGLDDTFMGLIYEADPESERFEIDFSVELKNIQDKDYDAIVFDINGNGITNKFYCSGNLEEVLNNLGNYGIVILVSDAILEKDVYIPANAVIDLNGYTLTGNVSAGGTVRIVDSRLGVDEAGTLDGKLGKGTFILTGGKYTSDVSAHLKNGYYVNENGYVRNRIYSVTMNGTDMELALSAAYINDTELVDFQALLVDVAVDVAMSVYNGSAITIDGKDIYNFSIEDITALLGSGKTAVLNSIIDILNPEGLSYVLNSVTNKVTDFNALADAINNDKPLAEYVLEVKSWDVVSYIADGNYLTFDSIASETNKKTGKFTVVIEGTEEEKAKLAELCKDLSVIEVNKFNIDFKDVSYANGFTVDLSGEVNVHINLAKNPAYAALICAAAAYGTSNWMNKAVYIAALEFYLDGKGTTLIAESIGSMTTAEMIAAFKAMNTVSCEEMLAAIGIDADANTQEISRLYASYDNIVKIGSAVVSKLGINGNGATLAGHKVDGTHSTYRFATELVGRINVTLEITTVPVSGEMNFGDINISGGVAEDKVKDFSTFEGENGAGIALDVHSNGIEIADFLSMLNLEVEGAISTEYVVLDKNGNEKTGGLICTGDVIRVVANNGINYEIIEKAVVIIGDTNGNGRTDAGDAAKIASYATGNTTMSEAEILAADLNGNGRVDAGDVAKVCFKATTDWNEYKER